MWTRNRRLVPMEDQRKFKVNNQKLWMECWNWTFVLNFPYLPWLSCDVSHFRSVGCQVLFPTTENFMINITMPDKHYRPRARDRKTALALQEFTSRWKKRNYASGYFAWLTTFWLIDGPCFPFLISCYASLERRVRRVV